MNPGYLPRISDDKLKLLLVCFRPGGEIEAALT